MVQETNRVKDVEPSINMMELRELVKLIQKESKIDFRNTILVNPVPINFGKAGAPWVTT